MYQGKYTKAQSPEEFAEFLRGLSHDTERLAAQEGPDALNTATSRFLEAAAAYIENLSPHGLFDESPGGKWQDMIGILYAALLYPIDEDDARP